jgi:aminoglycoside 6'-N-acetyltransferase
VIDAAKVLNKVPASVMNPSFPTGIAAHALSFRPLAATDLPRLTAWLAEPHVRTFYQKTLVSLADVTAEYGPVIRGEEPSLSHIALSAGVPFAYLQCYRNSDYPEWAELIGAEGGISIDLFIGDPAFLHRGLGRAVLREYLRQVAFPAFAGEPQAYIGHELTNTAALRCSCAVGFRPLRHFIENGIETSLLVIDLPMP